MSSSSIEMLDQMGELEANVRAALESGAIDRASQDDSMDFSQPQREIELLQQMVNPSEHYRKEHPEISRDFATSNLPQRVIWLIYNKLQKAKFKEIAGLSFRSEYQEALTLITLFKSLNGWLVREIRTNSVRVDNSSQKRKRWFGRD